MKFLQSFLFTAAFSLSSQMALAADIEPAPTSSSAFFGYIEGGYLFETNTHLREFDSPGFDAAESGDGWDGSGKLGYRMNDVWDIAVGGRYFDQSGGDRNDDTFDWENTDGQYWNADLEFGYTTSMGGATVRPFLGVRYQEWEADFTDNVAPIFSGRVESWGVGPRIGFDASAPLSDGWSLFANADASVLFGDIESIDTSTAGFGWFVPEKRNRTFWTAGAKLGINWEIASSIELGAGYKVEWLDGINYSAFGSGVSNSSAGSEGELIHGPFARLTFGF